MITCISQMGKLRHAAQTSSQTSQEQISHHCRLSRSLPQASVMVLMFYHTPGSCNPKDEFLNKWTLMYYASNQSHTPQSGLWEESDLFQQWRRCRGDRVLL